MLEFKKLTLNDIDRIKPYFIIRRNRNCDSTIGGSFMWRDYFNTEFVIDGGSLMFKVNVPPYGNTGFTFPMGGDIHAALEKLSEYCNTKKIPLMFCVVSSADLKLLKEYFDNTKETLERDWCDYLYNAEDLCFLRGKKFSGQRNHINKFVGAYPEYLFEELCPENIHKARSFFERISEETAKLAPTAREEASKVFEVLDNFEVYGLFGAIITIGEDVAAMSLGETIGDTLFVHIEKADRQYQGAYQIMVNEFAKHFTLNRVEYINREEDVGDEGLRTSKLSYHPVELLEKYTVLIENE